MWINPSTNQVFTLLSDIRLAFKHVSFPREMTESDFLSVGLMPVKQLPQPEYDHTKNVTEGPPALHGGEWVQVWNVADASEEEIQERTEWKAASIRNDRNLCLANSDWTQLTDAPLTVEKSGEWQAYRQELREVPEQSGFPWDVQWPIQPE